jgi:uroporphyrinogen-III synthase
VRALAASGAVIPVVAIGPLTAAAAKEAGLVVAAEADEHDADGLVTALASLA